MHLPIYLSACVYRFNSIQIDIPNYYWRCFVFLSRYKFKASFLLMIKRALIDRYLPTLRFKIKRTLIDYLLTFIKPSLESTETVPCLTGRKSVVTVQVIIFPEPWAECGVRLPPLVWTAVLTRFNLTSESLELRWWMMGTSLCSSVPRNWNGTEMYVSFWIWGFWIVCVYECKSTYI